MIQIKTFVLGSMYTNTYLIKDVSTNSIAVVDPAEKSDDLVRAIDDLGGKLDYILLTHGHFDHIGFVKELCKKYMSSVLIGKDDFELINQPMLNLSAFRSDSISDITVDRQLNDGDIIHLGDTDIKYISTPGHTSGSGCYIADDCIFSGDTLFCESAGRTDFPTGSYKQMVSSLQRLFDLDGEYKVYPGHDVATDLSHERKYNPFVRL